MKIGYPCINLSLECRSSRTFRLASYSEKRLAETVENNLSCLMETLEFNIRNELLFFRITSDLIPFASHPVCTFSWQKAFESQFAQIGKFIGKQTMRVSMHPDQFVLINSPDKGIFERTVKELMYHAEVLDLLGVDRTAKIQIHAGGVYGDKKKSLERFVKRYRVLPGPVRQRLVVENDERLYSVGDCLAIHERTDIPVIFDVFHFTCNNRGQSLREGLMSIVPTWSSRDGLPIVDYSSQEKGKRTGTHAQSIDTRDFSTFLKETEGLDFDIMLEIKDKERSALKARKIINRLGHPTEK